MFASNDAPHPSARCVCAPDQFCEGFTGEFNEYAHSQEPAIWASIMSGVRQGSCSQYGLTAAGSGEVGGEAPTPTLMPPPTPAALARSTPATTPSTQSAPRSLPMAWVAPVAVGALLCACLALGYFRRISRRAANAMISRDRAQMDLQLITHHISKGHMRRPKSANTSSSHSQEGGHPLGRPPPSLPPAPPSSASVASEPLALGLTLDAEAVVRQLHEARSEVPAGPSVTASAVMLLPN